MTESTLSIMDLVAGTELPRREHTATNVSLFLYNAAVWNPHRIHYDERYAIDAEGHAGIVIDGPLQGDWLSQVALNWLGESGQLVQFSYSNRQAAHLGETLTSGGRVTSVDITSRTVELEMFIANESGDVITPGTGTALLAR